MTAKEISQGQIKVTIGIPTYNRLGYLREALDSALRQTYKNIEIVVSDNASEDGTEEYLRGLLEEGRIKYVRQSTNIGMVGNWNACLSLATGEYFLLLSDDDVLAIDAIADMVEFVGIERPVGVYGKVFYLEADAGYEYVAPASEPGLTFLKNYLEGRRLVYPSAFMYRTEIANSLGGYPPVGSAADFGMMLQLFGTGFINYIDNAVAGYRMHSGALTNTPATICSNIDLYAWVASSENVSPELVKKTQDYCRRSSFKWVLSQQLKGNQAGVEKGLEVIKELRMGLMYRYFICLVDMPIVRWTLIRLKSVFR